MLLKAYLIFNPIFLSSWISKTRVISLASILRDVHSFLKYFNKSSTLIESILSFLLAPERLDSANSFKICFVEKKFAKSHKLKENLN